MADNIMLKVEGEEGLYRDPSSNAIINKNKRDWLKHKAKRKAIKEKQARLDSLEKEVSEIKDMLSQVLKAINKEG